MMVEIVTPELREPIHDYAAAVARFGETLGQPVPEHRLDQVLDAIAADSVDVFGSKAAAARFLAESPIEGTRGAKAVALDIGISRILSRIDGLRFGAFG
ncbi:hypothetical protein [Brevundimonas sp. SL130]|uniref:hypothetical protein n=1 Tax=Brevundimonas sp. SL130 TaxID=2995143 RepID=UPI00226D3726|nr:hypothetical protein [Brevundimonas sp. SL130]WAC59769.1 hypothetical protein OU998_16415 [Brevundimonas sp. SL130]